MTRAGTCEVAGCSKVTDRHRYCGMHRHRLRRYGMAELPDARPWPRAHGLTLAERIEAYSALQPTGCIEWTGHRDARGYGKTKGPDGIPAPAHRVNYELKVGAVPDGLELDHLCRNTSCINPEHLEPVTHNENMRRSALARTHCPQGHPYSGDNLIVRIVP